MPEADLLGADGQVVGTLMIPEGASPEAIQRAGQQALAHLQGGGGMAPAAADHPTTQELRAGRGPVDIPESNSLMLGHLANNNAQLPWYQRMAAGVTDPPQELAVQAGRALTPGNTIPALPPLRLLEDAVQTAALLTPAFPAGRAASAAIQGGAGFAQALQAATDTHRTSGERTWQDQLGSLDMGDALMIGGSAAAGATIGALFPTDRGVSKRLSIKGGIQGAADDFGNVGPRMTEDMLLPAPRAGETTAAFARLDRNAPVDATEWKGVLSQWAYDRKPIPAEVQAIAERMKPVMETVPVPVNLAPQAGALGVPIHPAAMPVQMVERQVYRNGLPVFTTTAGDVLDANMNLGNMVNTQAARNASGLLGHTPGNLRALKGELTRAVAQGLPKDQQPLFAAARETALEVSQAHAGMRLVESYVNPSDGRINGPGLYNALTGKARGKWIQATGKETYGQLLRYAKSVQAITSSPEKGATFRELLRTLGAESVVAGGLAGAAKGIAGGGMAGVLPTAGVAAVALPAADLAARTVYALATSQPALHLLDTMAKAPVGSQPYLAAVGRLAVAHALMQDDVGQHLQTMPDLPTPPPKAPKVAPPLPPMATPLPLGAVSR